MYVFIFLIFFYFRLSVTGSRDPKDVDPRLIVPVLDDIFPFYYLPEHTKKYYRFGIDHEGVITIIIHHLEREEKKIHREEEKEGREEEEESSFELGNLNLKFSTAIKRSIIML